MSGDYENGSFGNGSYNRGDFEFKKPLTEEEKAAEAAVQKSQEAMVRGLKRKGRRASILTSGMGVPDKSTELGVPGAS